MSKILRDPAHIVREKSGEQKSRTLNLYANEAACRMARSVADKFSMREDVFFPLTHFYGNFGEISPFNRRDNG